MNPLKTALMLIIIIAATLACRDTDDPVRKLKLFSRYFTALKEAPDTRWDYTSDTVSIWFDDKSGEPVVQVKGSGSTGSWKEWDEVMNATTSYDSIWYDPGENAVLGRFYENNDFYELIGKPPTKTLRTYWFDEHDKIREILIFWIPEENTTTSEHLEPILEWAQMNDSMEVEELYVDGRLVPSGENARRWKKLLLRYRDALKTEQK